MRLYIYQRGGVALHSRFAQLVCLTLCLLFSLSGVRGDFGAFSRSKIHESFSSDRENRLFVQPIRNPTVSSGVNVSGTNETTRYYSGYFKLARTYDAHMFFFLFEARKHSDTAPVVLWMTGGPGCSSEMAVFYENGPWHLEKDDEDTIQVVDNPYGWDAHATVIFVDQPVNTGFSYSENPDDRCYDEECVSRDMVDFMSALLEARPDLRQRDFYVTGESYAGHYVPAVAYHVFLASHAGQKYSSSSKISLDIQLKGLAIGNGLTYPAIQYGAYPEFAYQHGLISESSRDRMMSLYPACKFALNACDDYSIAAECYLAVELCQALMFTPIMMENPGVNVYDYRKECEGDLCYDFSLLDEYLNQPDVKKSLGVPDDKDWEECNMDVHEDMMSDWGHRYDTVLPEMLEAGVRVMIYAGDKDIICNELGNRQWVDALEWKGSKEWQGAENVTWVLESGEEAGIVTQVGPLSFVSVKDAGHMVPMDQPKAALEMITKFIQNENLVVTNSGHNDDVSDKGWTWSAVVKTASERMYGVLHSF